MRSNYSSNYKKLGGLGPNTGTQDWQSKKDKMEKIHDYGASIKLQRSPQRDTRESVN
jgi:hypothetical protein